MGSRRVRVLLGEAAHAAGALTSPAPPEIMSAARGGQVVRVAWRLSGAGPRRGRHLYVTVHERHVVLASRIVRNAATEGSTTVSLPQEVEPDSVLVSAYNGLRQRSDPTGREVAPEAED
jgi:hypothetical protein